MGFTMYMWPKVKTPKYKKTNVGEQVLAELRRLVDKYAHNGEDVSVTVASHSLGAALAILNAMDIVSNDYNYETRLCAYPMVSGAGKTTFSSPRVGDKGFLDVSNGLTNDHHVLRIRNSNDPVPRFPTEVLLGYRDVGEKLEIDSRKSPYLKCPIAQPHNLELYLHAIAGYQGKDNEFKLVVDRDISLLNKFVDLLADKYKIPPKWWAVKNNGMIQMDDGFWKLNDYVPDPPSDDEGIITSPENSNLSPA